MSYFKVQIENARDDGCEAFFRDVPRIAPETQYAEYWLEGWDYARDMQDQRNAEDRDAQFETLADYHQQMESFQ